MRRAGRRPSAAWFSLALPLIRRVVPHRCFIRLTIQTESARSAKFRVNQRFTPAFVALQNECICMVTRWGISVEDMIRREPVISERAILTFVGCLALIVAAMAVMRWVA